MAAPVVASESWNEAFASSVVVTKPTGTASGDRLVVHGLIQSVSTAPVFTPPAGWTLVDSYAYTNQGLYPSLEVVLTKVAGGSEPASYTFTSTPGDFFGFQIVRITGASASLGPNSKTSKTTGTTLDFPSVTTAAADSLILLFGWTSFIPSSSWADTVPSGTTRLTQPTTGKGYGGARFVQATAGATGTKTVAAGGSLASDLQGVGFTVAIPPTSTNGSASGASLAATSSLIAGAASAVRNAAASGVVLAAVVSLLVGTATGQRNASVSGQSLAATASLSAGSASGVRSPTASGSLLTAASSIIDGGAVGVSNGAASGSSFPLTVSLFPGIATSGTVVAGAALEVGASLSPGGASATSSATASGTALSTAYSLTSGSASGETSSVAVGAPFSLTASLSPGIASAVRNASASGPLLNVSTTLEPGQAVAGSVATGATISASASVTPGAASGAAVTSGLAFAVQTSLTAGTASGSAVADGRLFTVSLSCTPGRASQAPSVATPPSRRVSVLAQDRSVAAPFQSRTVRVA